MKWPTPRLGLRFKAMATVLVVVTMAVGMVAVATITQTNRRILADERRSVDVMARSVSAAAELPLAVDDRVELARIGGIGDLFHADCDFHGASLGGRGRRFQISGPVGSGAPPVRLRR